MIETTPTYDATPEFALALTRAEAALFEVVSGLARPVCGRVKGRIGADPVAHDSFALQMTAPNPADASFWSAHAFPALPYGARVVGAFRTREAAQRFIMLLVGGLPVRTSEPASGEPVAGSLQQVRVSDVGEVDQTTYEGDNVPAPWAWTVTVGLDVVFRTGSRTV